MGMSDSFAFHYDSSLNSKKGHLIANFSMRSIVSASPNGASAVKRNWQRHGELWNDGVHPTKIAHFADKR